MKEGGLPLPLAISYDMKSLWFKFGHDIFAVFKMTLNLEVFNFIS